ncbi:hypothetical protein AMTRI_Chr05g69680 [Amborella trichopoda]
MATTAITASTMFALSTLRKNLSISLKLKLNRADSRVCKSNVVHLESLSRKLKLLLEFVSCSMLKLGRIFYV